ncbi:SRPBCC family protein [Demequina subtropica]|uniref:SRPBCC family protein n=1 Tax=Demequina subtropica TaxID=1638989 RepID=UPI000781676C|nr:SRPBCC family protein [Demequina subtropica]
MSMMSASRPWVDLDVHVDAPVHAVFEYCRDPRNIHDGDPVEVVDVELTDDGVGTTAHLDYPAPFPLEEDVDYTVTESLADQRLVYEARSSIWLRGHHRPHHDLPLDVFVWTFAPEDDGTRLRVEVHVEDPTLGSRLAHASFRDVVAARLDRIAEHFGGAASS